MWPIIGHQWAIELLTHGIQTRKLSHAYLFVGPNQVGKRTLGNALSQAILCTEENAPCGTCRSCQLIHRGRHPDVQVVASDGNRIKIEAIREMQHLVALSPVEGPYRIILIPEFDRATTSAANALLKTLEEPPSTVILILTATNVEALLPTIVSRCQIVPLRLVPAAEIRAALISRGIAADRARLLSHLAQGRIGWALDAAQDESQLEKRDKIMDSLSALARGGYTTRFAWAEQLSRKPNRVAGVLEAMTSWWHDILLLSAQSTTPITNIDRQDELHDWASRYPVGAAKGALQAIRETTWKLEHNANLRLALEVLALDLPITSHEWNHT